MPSCRFLKRQDARAPLAPPAAPVGPPATRSPPNRASRSSSSETVAAPHATAAPVGAWGALHCARECAPPPQAVRLAPQTKTGRWWARYTRHPRVDAAPPQKGGPPASRRDLYCAWPPNRRAPSRPPRPPALPSPPASSPGRPRARRGRRGRGRRASWVRWGGAGGGESEFFWGGLLCRWVQSAQSRFFGHAPPPLTLGDGPTCPQRHHTSRFVAWGGRWGGGARVET